MSVFADLLPSAAARPALAIGMLVAAFACSGPQSGALRPNEAVGSASPATVVAIGPPPPATASADGMESDVGGGHPSESATPPAPTTWQPIPARDRPPLRGRGAALDAERCDVTQPGATSVDLNGDGAPDLIKLRRAGKLICQVVDLNFDGRLEVVTHFDDAGKPRRHARDFDFDGKPDAVEILRHGALVEKQLDTNADGRSDTWQQYEGGKLLRTESDTDGDGRADLRTVIDVDDDVCRIHFRDSDGDGYADTRKRECDR